MKPEELQPFLRTGTVRKGEDGQDYLVLELPDKTIAIPIAGYIEVDGQQLPNIKVESEEIPNDQGGVDVVVRVPCLTVAGKTRQPVTA